MKNNLKPLGVHIVLTIIAIIGLNFMNSFDQVMINPTTRTIAYLCHTIIMISLYIFFSKRYLAHLPQTNLINGTGIILLINIILVLFHYGMISIEMGLILESAGLPMIILSTFNSSFFSTIQLISGAEIIKLIILVSASPLIIFISSRILDHSKRKKV
jgi:hypothetical protein